MEQCTIILIMYLKNDSQGVILKRFLYIFVFFIKFMTLRFNNVITIDLNDVPFNFHMALNNFKETPINYKSWLFSNNF